MNGMMKRNMRILIAAMWLLLWAVPVHAHRASAGAEFSVRALLPEGQSNRDVAYFDLQTLPGDEHTLQVEVYNHGDEQITVDVRANEAISNAHGGIDYLVGSDEGGGFGEMVFIDMPAIDIEPGESVLAQIQLKMPQEGFDGEVLGGLVFTKRLNQDDMGAAAMSIRHSYNYCIAVRLTQGELPQPMFSLDEVKLAERAGFAALVLAVRNERALIVKDMELDIKVYDAAGVQRFHWTGEGLSMAPNSLCPYTILMREGMPLYEGLYAAKVMLRYGGQTWDLGAVLEVS